MASTANLPLCKGGCGYVAHLDDGIWDWEGWCCGKCWMRVAQGFKLKNGRKHGEECMCWDPILNPYAPHHAGAYCGVFAPLLLILLLDLVVVKQLLLLNVLLIMLFVLLMQDALDATSMVRGMAVVSGISHISGGTYWS